VCGICVAPLYTRSLILPSNFNFTVKEFNDLTLFVCVGVCVVYVCVLYVGS